MNSMRNRVKDNFPTVLLTLLSIVQALALEFLWVHIHDSDYLLELSVESVLCWLQIIGNFCGLALIWVFYASVTMRFRWVPGTGDSIFPFIIGLLEFLQIELLGLQHFGIWLLVLAALFAFMVWVSHHTMRTARQDPDNAEFFRKFERATLRDFIPHMIVIGAMTVLGITLHVMGNIIPLMVLALLLALGVMLWQFYMVAITWKQSIQD